MKTIRNLSIIICSLLLFQAEGFSQNVASKGDKITINKPSKWKRNYVINAAGLTKVVIKKGKPKRTHSSFEELPPDLNLDYNASFGDGNIGIQWSRPDIFRLKSTLDCNSDALSWHTHLYCPGIMEKTRNFQKMEGGGRTITGGKNIYLYWNLHSNGFIIENQDTICCFIISMNSRSDSALIPFSREVYSGSVSPLKSSSKNRGYLERISSPVKEFGIYGTFRQKDFALLTNGLTYQSFIYLDKHPASVFQSDIDFQQMLKKADRIQPYLLPGAEKDENTLQDLLRLALLSRYLTTTLGGL